MKNLQLTPVFHRHQAIALVHLAQRKKFVFSTKISGSIPLNFVMKKESLTKVESIQTPLSAKGVYAQLLFFLQEKK